MQRALKEAHQSRIAAEKAKEARGEFLANMSHELRTPMNGIIGLSGILLEGETDVEKRTMLDAVNTSSRNLLTLLNDILDFSKIEAGEISIEKIPFSARQIIRQLETLHSPIAYKKGIGLYAEIDESAPEWIEGDPARLRQILNNLIGNALKFTHTGSVKIKMEKLENQDTPAHTIRLKFSIEDSGIGIPKDKQSVIFEKFQQADNSTSRQYGGTGLGLAITKNLIQFMNGSIELDSEEGVGTTISFILDYKPAQKDILQQPHIEIPSHDADNIQTLLPNTMARILIVDDHPVNLLFMRQILIKSGFKNIDEAIDGQSAIDLYIKHHHRLILMDCQMPDIDGIEATRKIRALPRKGDYFPPVIIAITADAMHGAIEKCMQAGMNDYMSKPIDKEKFMALLNKWIPQHFHSQENVGKKINLIQMDTDMSELKTINSEILYDFTEGNQFIEQDIRAVFTENLKLDIAGLEKAISSQSYAIWIAGVHKLYGSCANFGAERMAYICDAAQMLDESAHQSIHETHKNIMKEYRILLEALQPVHLKMA